MYLAAAPELVEALARWTAAYAEATMHRLRGQVRLGPSAALLPVAESAEVLRAEHVPLAISRRMSGFVAEGYRRGLVTDIIAMTLEGRVQSLVDCLGACERIRNTPMPFAYMVHLRRALILYCFTLPFALLDRFGWWTIPAVLLVAYILYGIEEIGVETEDPFGEDENDLPLERICQAIAGNLQGLVSGPPAEPVAASRPASAGG